MGLHHTEVACCFHNRWGGLGEMDPLHLRRFVIVEKLDVCYAGEGMFPQPSRGLLPSFPCPRTRWGLSNRFPTQKQTISVTMWRQLCFLALMGMWYTPHPRPAFHIHEYVYMQWVDDSILKDHQSGSLLSFMVTEEQRLCPLAGMLPPPSLFKRWGCC
jgi:hypothetical protein